MYITTVPQGSKALTFDRNDETLILLHIQQTDF